MDIFYIPWIAELIANGGTSDENQFVIVSNELEEIKPKYRLIFFDGKGILEVSRMILAYSGVPFIDIRLSYRQWLSKIDDISYKLVPILQFDDKIICQGTAIARYLARIYGLSGKNLFEEAQVDSVMDIVKSFIDEMKVSFIFYFQKFKTFDIDLFVPEIRASIQEQILKYIQKYMPLLESVCSNNYSHGFIFTSGLTFADFAVASIFETLEEFYPESVESYENVKHLNWFQRCHADGSC